jgi:predicted component of type VI protein secretion system
MPAQLVALNDGPSILLDKPILLLGRHPECDIQIDSRKVSRRHCCIAQVSDYLVVRDLGSTNGIRINGVRVQEGRLAPGDELTIGNHRFRVSWESMAALQPRPPAPFKDTLRSALPADQVADDLLESCEEPVPLAEPAARPRPAGVPSQRRTDLVPPSPPPPSRGPDSGASVIVPDDLRLLPSSSSDVYPNLPSHHSGSHPPPA